MNGALPPPTRWPFRSALARYLIAELIPFVSLSVGLLMMKELQPYGAPFGAVIALLGGSVGTFYYAYKVLGSSGGWAFPLILLALASTDLGSMVTGIGVVYDAAHPHGTQPVATATYWLAWGSVLGATAVTVALAVATGERWTRRHLPRDKYDAMLRSRGEYAFLWLASYWPREPVPSRAARILAQLFSLLER